MKSCIFVSVMLAPIFGLLPASLTANEDDPDYLGLYRYIPAEEFADKIEEFGPRPMRAFEFQPIDYPTGKDNPRSYRFDMGPASAPTPAGYTRVTKHDVFSWEKRWGWTNEAMNEFAYSGPLSVSDEKKRDYEVVLLEVERRAFHEEGKQLDPRSNPWRHDLSALYEAYLDDVSRDAVLNPEELTFKVALPNGRYQVTMILGDLRLPRHGMELFANGELVASNPLQSPLAWPGRVSFSVTVARNNLRLTLREDANAFEERSEVAAATPDYNFSQLPYVLGQEGGRLQPYFGKRTNVMGPPTQMAIAGITITPYEPAPLEMLRQHLFISPGVEEPNLVEGVQRFNEGDLKAAEASFLQIPESLPELKAHAYLALAGHLETDLVEELAFVDRAVGLLESVCKSEPGNIRAEETLRALRIYRGAAYCSVHLFRPMVKVEGSHSLETAAQDSQLRGRERFKNHVLFTSAGPGDLYYSKSLMRMGRYIVAGEPHRWSLNWPIAEEAFQKLQDLVPGNRFSNYFLYWDARGWDVKDYKKDTAGAPRWATVTREAYNRLLDHAEWWGANRLHSDGSIGGGWGDDVEINLVWQIVNLINPDASADAMKVSRAISEGVWWSGEINRDLGFFDGIDDVEHSAEWTADTLALRLGIEYGNPVIFERCMLTAKRMRDLWMGVNDAGHLHFKSIMLGADEIGSKRVDYRAAMDSLIDHPLQGRAASPAFWAWWHSPLDGLDDLFIRWAEAWYAHAMSDAQGKAAGIIPGAIGFETDRLGGNEALAWRIGSPRSNPYENPTYSNYILSLFGQMYKKTRDPKWLEPKAARLGDMELDVSHGIPVPNLDEGTEVKDKYALLDSLGIERLLGVIRMTWPSVTSDNTTTDRIGPPGLGQIIQLLTGGNIAYGLDHIPMTFEKTSRDVAFMNLASRSEFVKTILYNFTDQPQEVHMRLWKLNVGASHEVMVGIDTNDDDVVDRVLESFTYTHGHRGDPIDLLVPPRQAVVVEVRQIDRGPVPPDRLIDLAMAPEGIEFSNGELKITVHNIGNKDCEAFTVKVFEGDAEAGREIGSLVVSGLEAPNDLEPRRTTLRVPWTQPSTVSLKNPSTVTVVVDPEDKYREITKYNNTVSRTFPHEIETYLIPRMWPTLAEQHGLDKGAEFSEHVPPEEAR